MLNNLEKQTSVPKVYAFLGLVGIYFFLIFFNIAGEFLVNFAGFLIPGYFSLEALFSASKVDDTQVRLLLPVGSFILIVLTVVDCKLNLIRRPHLLSCSPAIIVLGCICILECFRECGQRCILVPYVTPLVLCHGRFC